MLRLVDRDILSTTVEPLIFLIKWVTKPLSSQCRGQVDLDVWIAARPCCLRGIAAEVRSRPLEQNPE